MRLTRIKIKNFRNFKNLNVRLGEHAVILGENKVGKTNLLFALRLLLDPSLPDSARQLRLDDFWDGLERPLGEDDVIGFADSPSWQRLGMSDAVAAKVMERYEQKLATVQQSLA